MIDGSKGRDICAKTRSFALSVIKVHQHIAIDSTGRVLGSQLLRAGTSVGANVEEAQAAQSAADFISKMSIALKEARETRYWLRLIVAAELADSEQIQNKLEDVEEIIKILFTIIQNTNRRRNS